MFFVHVTEVLRVENVNVTLVGSAAIIQCSSSNLDAFILDTGIN